METRYSNKSTQLKLFVGCSLKSRTKNTDTSCHRGLSL